MRLGERRWEGQSLQAAAKVRNGVTEKGTGKKQRDVVHDA